MAITGAGTSGDPFVIYDFSDLELIGTGIYTLSSHYRLNNDIDASPTAEPTYNGGAGWNPIGLGVGAFTGGFNGNSKVISNLYINRPETNDIGFISSISSNNVLNIILENCEITGLNNVGGIASYIGSFQTTSGHTVKGIINGNNKVSGILAETFRSGVNNCNFEGVINGSGISIGGIVGYLNSTSTSTNTLNSGSVKGIINGVDYIGGFIGDIDYVPSGISNCYAMGSVEGNNIVAGFLGMGANVNIDNSYSNTLITGNTNKNGFASGSSAINVTNSFWDINSSNQPTSVLGTPKTTIEMKDPATYSTWDFDTVWALESNVNDGYPNLQWYDYPNPLIINMPSPNNNILLKKGQCVINEYLTWPEPAILTLNGVEGTEIIIIEKTDNEEGNIAGALLDGFIDGKTYNRVLIRCRKLDEC